jgi:hypothetical protein
MTHMDLLELARSNRAFSAIDNFVIVNNTTGAPIESHFTRRAADHFCEVANDHERRNNRPAVYTVQEVTE